VKGVMPRIVPAVLLTAMLAAAGCSNSPTEPGPLPSAPYSATDLVVGAGTEATVGRTLSAHYTGWLYDPTRPESKGTQFDSSAGRAPFSFVLGTGNVIQGWHQGFTGMRVGGKRRLILPPNLGYGSQGSGPIPPNATLVFDVELVGVQ
jgi:FKBP-type peptidyl-prolyl cis-trans isomerase FkpA